MDGKNLFNISAEGLQFISSTFSQGLEFTHSLISLKSNKRLWAIHSDRSRQMSDCEQIAQVAHLTNEQFSQKMLAKKI